MSVGSRDLKAPTGGFFNARTPVWWLLWAVLLSLTWLLPNHTPPWTAFHSDAWMALLALLSALPILWRDRSGLMWHRLSCTVAALVCLPWAHYAAGLIPFAGQAWISSVYLLGLLLALLVGACWEAQSRGQLPESIFLAIGLASIISVGLQFATWLDLLDNGLTDIWSIGLSSDRPYANLGQPNQLATLLLWGLLAFLWAYLKGAIGKFYAVFAVAFLLSGLALTQSRTGYLALTFLLAAAWHWRRLWPAQRLPWVATGLYVFFLGCPLLLRSLKNALLLGQNASLVRPIEQGELRWGVWKLFVHGILERPWFGFGWTDLASVQVALADQFAGLGIAFNQSHNLLLDLILWNGLPIGLLLAAVLLSWVWSRLHTIRQADDATLMMMLCVAGIHAMLELPLHHAYFLLPVGFFMGALEARLGSKIVFTSRRVSLAALWLVAALALGLTIRDYFKVEASYTYLRFENAHIKVDRDPNQGPPDVWVLTQFRELIRFVRFTPTTNMTPAELTWLRAVAATYPSAGNLYKLAAALALNDQTQEAHIWLDRMCNVVDKGQCLAIQSAWSSKARQEPKLTSVAWPK